MSQQHRQPWVGIQIGRMNAPAQVFKHYPEKSEQSKNRTMQVYIYNDETINRIMELENQKLQKNPELKLNSCLSELSEDENGQRSALLRLKCTTKEERYTQQSSEAPAELRGVDYGVMIVAKCNVREWEYEGECGIVVYANLVMAVGVNDSPQGKPFVPSVIHWD
jgi:hypothetical protein